MIKILERYIAKTIILSTLVFACIVLGVLFLIFILSEFKNIGEGDYGITQSILYVLMRLPSELYQFSPLLLLLGSMIGLSILSSYLELAVMRTAGFSLAKIIFSVLSAALLFILVISFIGEWIAPNLRYKAEIKKAYARNAGQAVLTNSGIWLHIDNNFIQIRRVIGRELLEGVTRLEFDRDHRLQAMYFAETLAAKNKIWKMFNGVKTSFLPDHIQSESFPEKEWNLKFNPNLLNVGVAPKEMSLPKLFTLAHYLKQNGLQATEYQFEFWQRIFQPLACLVMIFLAIPFVLSTLSTTTMGWRIIAGIMTGFAFFIFNAFLGQLCVVYQLPTMLAALLPPTVFAIIGILMCKSMVRR